MMKLRYSSAGEFGLDLILNRLHRVQKRASVRRDRLGSGFAASSWRRLTSLNERAPNKAAATPIGRSDISS